VACHGVTSGQGREAAKRTLDAARPRGRCRMRCKAGFCLAPHPDLRRSADTEASVGQTPLHAVGCLPHEPSCSLIGRKHPEVTQPQASQQLGQRGRLGGIEMDLNGNDFFHGLFLLTARHSTRAPLAAPQARCSGCTTRTAEEQEGAPLGGGWAAGPGPTFMTARSALADACGLPHESLGWRGGA
jgi:hypothetical protein